MAMPSVCRLPRSRSIAPGTSRSFSRFFSHAAAAGRRSNVCASECTDAPARLMRICAVYDVDPSARLRAMMVPKLLQASAVATP